MASLSETDHAEQKSNMKWIVWAVIGLTIGVLLAFLLLNWLRPYQYHGMEIAAETPVTNFELTGPGGEPVRLIDFRDQVVLIYFGYTFCPDVCPATMVELDDAMELLGNKAEDVQVLMITLDPQRDTYEQLESYVTHFNDDFIGLTGTEEELLTVTSPLGIFYEKHEGTPQTGYLIDHTATVAALDKRGHMRLIYPFGTTGEEIAEDVKHLLRD